MLVTFVIITVWLLVSAAAVVICAAARRTDDEIDLAERATVIELDASAVASRRHSVA